MEDKITITELTKVLQGHPCFTDPEHPHYSDSVDDAVTAEQVHGLWKRLKLQGVSKDEFNKAVGCFISRENLYGPIWFIETYGFDDKGRCIIGRGVRKNKKADWHMAEPYRAPLDERRRYYAERNVGAVDENLRYVDTRAI